MSICLLVILPKDGGPKWTLLMTHWISLYSPLPPPSGTDTLDIGPHCIETPWTWYLTVQCLPWAWGLTIQSLTSTDIWWTRQETFSNLFTWGPPGVDIWWLLKKHVRLMQVGSTNPTRMLSCLQCNQWTTIITMEDQLSLFQTTAFFSAFHYHNCFFNLN